MGFAIMVIWLLSFCIGRNMLADQQPLGKRTVPGTPVQLTRLLQWQT
jgi:hypothetical protein